MLQPGCSVHTSEKCEHCSYEKDRNWEGVSYVVWTIKCFVILQASFPQKKKFSARVVCVTVLKMHCHGVMHIKIDYSARCIPSKATFHAWLKLWAERSIRCHSDWICCFEKSTAVFHNDTAQKTVKAINEPWAIFCYMEGNKLVRP